ncbi:MAG: hypothetical protein JW849_11370 [Phycisphaerae bacterium]|nr:hypothetical protein [Phycisphaerae bacterium]
MNHESSQADATRNQATKDKDRRRVLLLLLLLLLLLIVAVAAYVLLKYPFETGPVDRQEPALNEPSGERFEFSAFYHSGDGTWVIRDEGILVLKERKFISASEKDAYTVHEVQPGQRVNILEADQRWKRVEVFPETGGEEPIAAGWIDAHHVRNADRVEPAAAPKSHKAMKQQYPH